MNILMTGCTGFIGSALAEHLYKEGHSITAAVRQKRENIRFVAKQVDMGNLGPENDWMFAFDKVDVVVHLAARVHVMNDTAVDALSEFRNTNTAATLNLARQSASAGVRRFIFLSSIKVNGEFTLEGKPFFADDSVAPDDYYGLSKYEAEKGLKVIAQQTNMEVVIIRPPLVYGAGVKGNFRSMMKLLHTGVPLPLGAIHNKRSLVALPNLIDLISISTQHPAAANQTFLVSDGDDLSTTQLLQCLSLSLGVSSRLPKFPQKLFEICLALLGKKAIASRLCDSLQVDINKTRVHLGWVPPVTVDKALQQTARAWLDNINK